jgi:hypothetical protein
MNVPNIAATIGAVFSGTDSTFNTGLWFTDGTAGGTSEILAGTQGAFDLNPIDFLVFGNEALRRACSRARSTCLRAMNLGQRRAKRGESLLP